MLISPAIGVLLVLTLVAVQIVHALVTFFEPAKASYPRAMLLVLGFVAFNWTCKRIGVPMHWLPAFAVYSFGTGALFWLLFRLKPLNCVSAGAAYVVARYCLIVGSYWVLARFGVAA